MSTPISQAVKHEPCEEFIENLTAQPWWDKNAFSWVTELEAKSSTIASELRSVLEVQELFKGKPYDAFNISFFIKATPDT